MKTYYAEAIQTQPPAIAEKAIVNCPSDDAAVQAARGWAEAMGLTELVVSQAGRRVFPPRQVVCSRCQGAGQVWEHKWIGFVGWSSGMVPCPGCKS